MFFSLIGPNKILEHYKIYKSLNISKTNIVQRAVSGWVVHQFLSGNLPQTWKYMCIKFSPPMLFHSSVQLEISAHSGVFCHRVVFPRKVSFRCLGNNWTPMTNTKKRTSMQRLGTKIELRKKPSYFPLYWLVYRDPYIGLLKSPYNCVGFHPLYNLNNQGPLFHCSIEDAGFLRFRISMG